LNYVDICALPPIDSRRALALDIVCHLDNGELLTSYSYITNVGGKCAVCVIGAAIAASLNYIPLADNTRFYNKAFEHEQGQQLMDAHFTQDEVLYIECLFEKYFFVPIGKPREYKAWFHEEYPTRAQRLRAIYAMIAEDPETKVPGYDYKESEE
jgi:hypothetical protein